MKTTIGTLWLQEPVSWMNWDYLDYIFSRISIFLRGFAFSIQNHATQYALGPFQCTVLLNRPSRQLEEWWEWRLCNLWHMMAHMAYGGAKMQYPLEKRREKNWRCNYHSQSILRGKYQDGVEFKQRESERVLIYTHTRTQRLQRATGCQERERVHSHRELNR